MLKLPHIFFALLGELWRVKAFFSKERVVCVVEMHPDGEDFSYVFLSTNSVFT